MKNTLLQISTSDGLYLHGFYVPADNKKVGVLHIHGYEGNFYENNFVHVLIQEMEKKQIGFLTVNTRGNGKETDINTVDGQSRKIGARYELLEESHLDITAWLQFLITEGYEQIVLMGHSLGTMKVVRYLFEGEFKHKVDKLILLAPFDKKGYLIVNGMSDVEDLLSKARAKIASGEGDERVTSEFEDTGMSYKTFVSWYEQDNLGRIFEFCSLDYDFPILKRISIPTKVIVGSKDEYFCPTNPEHHEDAMKMLLDHIPNSTCVLLADAVHSFKPHEVDMAGQVSAFVLGEK